ncbi:MAG: MFS transporter, partial [Anaerolineales bacterium]|nr:MFS transporter [Anaerolineales bacterium]
MSSISSTEAVTTTAAPAAKTGLHKLSMAAIMLGHTAVDMQTSALAVLLPPLLAAFNLNYAGAAAIISANNLVIAVAQPLIGILGDYRRARWLVPLGCVLCGGAMASVMFMPNYWLVVLAVMLSGLGSAAFHPEALSSTRAISGEQKATGSSLFFFAGNVGFALGPLAAAWLIDTYNPQAAVWLIVPIVLGLAALMTQYRHFQQGTLATRPSGSTRALLRDKKTLGVVAFILLFITVRLTITAGLTTFIPLYFHELSTLTKPEIAQLLTVLSIAGTVGTLLSGPAAERIGRRAVIVGTMAISLAGLYVFMHSDGWVRLVALAVAGAVMSAPWTLSVIV